MDDTLAPAAERHAPAFASTGPVGHRGRMRSRLLTRGPAGLADYEMLEMLLFLSIPRRDTKPLAKAVINRFGDLYRTLTGAPADLLRAGLPTGSVDVIALVREAARRLALAQAVTRPHLNGVATVKAYLDLDMRLRRPAHVAVLLLNNRNLLLEELSFPHLQDAVAIARIVATRSLEVHATALILATLQPGAANPDPDEYDLDLTRRIVKMGRALSITLHDHMIFGASGHESLKSWGIL